MFAVSGPITWPVPCEMRSFNRSIIASINTFTSNYSQIYQTKSCTPGKCNPTVCRELVFDFFSSQIKIEGIPVIIY